MSVTSSTWLNFRQAEY